MDLAVITAQQVAELFILIGLGALGAKTGLLRPEGKQTLSNLLVNLVVPTPKRSPRACCTARPSTPSSLALPSTCSRSRCPTSSSSPWSFWAT